MSLAGYEAGLARILRGDFGESWLQVAASGTGLDHGRPATTDLEKADVQLTLREEVNGTYNPTVKVQVKTTDNLRDHDGKHWAYDLDVETYNVLVRTNQGVRRALAVIGLSEDGETVRLEEDGTLLLGRAAWVSLEGQPPTANSATKVVYLPKANTVDGPGLQEMLRSYGTSRSSSVPVLSIWDEEVWS